MDLRYKIRFLDYWHLASGLSAGVKADSIVVKDSVGLPFVPGKTLKGLTREMALAFDCAFIDKCFGVTTDKDDKCYDEQKKPKEGECYFANATLPSEVKEQIISNHLQDNLYDTIASTKIDDKGIADDNTLREIEVVIPLTLYGEVNGVPEEYQTKMEQSLQMIKRMGLNRNRGLGRCTITVEVIS